MPDSNKNVPTNADVEVSTLGVYSAETPPEDEISDDDMNDLLSAAEIAVALIAVTPLSDSLPQGVVDAPRIYFTLPDRGKASASSVVANPFVSYMENAPSSSTFPTQADVDNDKDCFEEATVDALQLSLSLTVR